MGGSSNNEIIISGKDIYQSFKIGDQTIEVLKGINFEVPANSFTIFYGPSGSGKSTLLNIISGLQKPTKGSLMYRDEDLYALNQYQVANFRASVIGIVYQTNYWVKSLSVLENVAMPLYFVGEPRRKANDQALEALKQIHMESYADRLPMLLSGGEQQRISMARALVSNPEFIVADEPTGNLDTKNSDLIMNLLQFCRTDLDRTVVLVTHDVRYLPMGDTQYQILDGKITETQDTQEHKEDLAQVKKEFAKKMKQVRSNDETK